MPTTFVLHGTAVLRTEPGRIAEHSVEQLEDFQHAVRVVENTVGMDEEFMIVGGILHVNIDTSEASHSAYDRIRAAMDVFLAQHAATGAIFTLEDDDFWVFGPTPLACWQAHFNHLQDLAIAADERLGAWVEANPAPDEDEMTPGPAPAVDPAPDAYDTARRIDRDNY